MAPEKFYELTQLFHPEGQVPSMYEDVHTGTRYPLSPKIVASIIVTHIAEQLFLAQIM